MTANTHDLRVTQMAEHVYKAICQSAPKVQEFCDETKFVIPSTYLMAQAALAAVWQFSADQNKDLTGAQIAEALVNVINHFIEHPWKWADKPSGQQ